MQTFVMTSAPLCTPQITHPTTSKKREMWVIRYLITVITKELSVNEDAPQRNMQK